MTVLGIDPGTAACGFGIVQGKGNRLRAVEFGWWQTSAKQRPELRLKTIFDGVIDLIEQFNPHAVAVEESFVGVDARTALSVGQARGAVLVAAASLGVECVEYAPSQREAGGLRLRPGREGAGAADGDGDPRAEEGADPASRSGCARRGDLPRAGPAPPPRDRLNPPGGRNVRAHA